MVTWSESMEFCVQMGGELPTESQWEYACRSGSAGAFSFGDWIRSDQVNYDGNYVYRSIGKGVGRKQPANVRAFEPNAWGLFGMHGNIREWCFDVYAPCPSGVSSIPHKDPKIVSGSSSHIVRGGSWSDSSRNLRSAVRSDRSPSGQFDTIGFRASRVI
jgi:sulfatase modifying factor 1